MKAAHKLSTGLAVGACLALASGGAAAAEVRTGERVHIMADTEIREDLYVAAREVIIDGVVRGDVIAAGADVTVRGWVEGSVMAVGGTVLVEGTVERAVRVVGGDVRIHSDVGSDAVAVCGRCIVGNASKVGADVLVAGGEVDLAGVVGRRVRASGERVRLAGATAAEAQVSAGRLKVEATAAGPALVYGVREAASISSGARIGHVELRPEWALASPRQGGGSFLASLMALVTGAVLLWLLPTRAASVSRLIAQRPASSMIWGLSAVIVAPGLIVLGTVAVVTLPLSALLAAVYLMAAYLGYLVSAYFVGESIVKRAGRSASPLSCFAVGVLVLLLVGLLPLVGAVARMLAVVEGVGALVLLLIESRWFTERFRRVRATSVGVTGAPPATGAA